VFGPCQLALPQPWKCSTAADSLRLSGEHLNRVIGFIDFVHCNSSSLDRKRRPSELAGVKLVSCTTTAALRSIPSSPSDLDHGFCICLNPLRQCITIDLIVSCISRHVIHHARTTFTTEANALALPAPHYPANNLYRRWVQHDSDGSAE